MRTPVTSRSLETLQASVRVTIFQKLILFETRLTHYATNDFRNYLLLLGKIRQIPKTIFFFNATAPRELGQSLPAYARARQLGRFAPRVPECVEECATALVFRTM